MPIEGGRESEVGCVHVCGGGVYWSRCGDVAMRSELASRVGSSAVSVVGNVFGARIREVEMFI